ncbi:hypothetical protein [Comamonas flocculans]|uniref:Nucleoside transporter/FeoB GTPase Gate domain-containing protein n=1 Tax=Comamonas flocculans TaxID=2597701 RepID=A0A5B8RUP4_9BURK|nr:hypothetical protein [Comamonas flocculans]QEA12823.1 hypothetical protein FOZ74_07175 [Comamonas flocculans]
MLRYLHDLGRRATHMFLTVARIMVPVMVLVYVAERLGLVRLAGEALSPAMAWLGLPAQAGIVWATTVITNIYGGIAVVAALSGEMQLTVAQMSALGAMMLFAHNLPTEQAVVRRAGASALFTGSLRLVVGAAYGAAVAWACHLGGWLQEPVALGWLSGSGAGAPAGPPALWPWLVGTVRSLLLIWLIICALVVLLDLLERLGFTRWLTRRLAPVLRLTGLSEAAAPLTTIGMLMGLAYGGALIIEASERENYDRRTLLLALCWLSLFHAVLEDTLLIAALGANIWIILVLRGVVVLAIMMALAFATRPATRWGQRLAQAR